MTQDRCPVTVLTGFLGSGKTTLLNALIHERQDIRVAVIVNEFGELGIDAALIDASEEDVVELSNGCLCCKVRGDLLEACERLAARRGDFDMLVVETSGLADPAPVVHSFLLADGPSEWFRLDGLVALADANTILPLLEENGMGARQIALADRIVVTKFDTVSAVAVARVIERLRLFNETAEIVLSSRERPASAALSGLAAYELASMPDQIRLAPAARHDESVSSVSLSFTAPFDFTALSAVIRDVVMTMGDDILRIKGIVSLAGEDRRFALHAVQSMMDGDVIGPWGDAPRHSRLVFIGRNLDRAALEASLAAALAADTSVLRRA
jgi:G3E family GTPase